MTAPTTTIPTTPADGEFATFDQWVRNATSWIGGANALCVDIQNRICTCGGDFMRARDEATFPVRFYYNAGGQNSSNAAAQRQCGRTSPRASRELHNMI